MKKRRVISGLFSLVMVFSLFGNNNVLADDKEQMKIYGLYLSGHDVEENYDEEDGADKYGDAILVESEGKYLLMDVGAEGASSSLTSYLRKIGVETLDIYISHIHADHRGGLEAVCKNFNVENVYLPDKSIGEEYVEDLTEISSEQIYSKMEDIIEEEDANIIYLKKGSSFSFGDVNATVLGPVEPSAYSMSQFEDKNGKSGTTSGHYLNNCSLTTMMECGETKYITCGDIEEEEERKLLEEYGDNLDADIMKMSHHGLATSNSEEFINAISPMYSFGENMGYNANVIVEKDGYSVVVPKTYTAQSRIHEHGMTYMVGDEKRTFVIDVVNNSVTMYKDSDKNGLTSDDEKMSGWVVVKGILQGDDGAYDDDNTFYIDEDGKPLTGMQKIDKKYYYFGNGGIMERGHYSYKETSGSYEYSGYRSYGDNKRYYRLDGEMLVGFNELKTSNGDKYIFYFKKSNGYRYVGNRDWKLVTLGGKVYAINQNGVVFNNQGSGGWKKYKADTDVGYNYRYFSKTGEMKTGWLTLGSNKYYLDAEGFRVLGYKIIGNNNYYFNPDQASGKAYKNKWKGLRKDGTMYYRYYGSTGAMVKGWKTVKGKNYYFDKITGFRKTGLTSISGKIYYFSSNGVMLKNEEKKISGIKCKFNAKGVMTKPKPKMVEGVKVKVASKNKNKLIWDVTKGCSGYMVYRSTKKAGTYEKIAVVAGKKNSSFVDENVKSGKKYYYYVVGYRNVSTVKAKGTKSSVVSVKTK